MNTLTERIQEQIAELKTKRQQLIEVANMQIAELNGRIAALSELLAEETEDADKDED